MSAGPHPVLVRIGVIGLGRQGQFQLESWHGDAELRMVVACDADRWRRESMEALCESIVDDAAVVCDDDRIDAVFIDVPLSQRAAIATAVLTAGKHAVVFDPHLARSTDEVQRLFDTAATSGKLLIVEPGWRNDLDFQSALTVMRSGAAGPVRSLRFERWTAAGPVCDNATGISNRPLRPTLTNRLDEAIELANCSPRRVYAIASTDNVDVLIEFDGGVTAGIGLRSNAAVVVETGWTFNSTQGGYSGGRRWIRTADAEVYHVPAEPLPMPGFKERFFAALRDDVSSSSMQNALRLAALATGIDESLRTGQAVEIESVAPPTSIDRTIGLSACPGTTP